MTTCRRPDLFVQTVASIRENVTDIDRVTQWIIVDDNTPLEHREQMVDATAWLGDKVTWIWKGPEDRGHARSMNMLREYRNHSDYIFHWEDDWRVVVASNYVERTIDALDEYPLLGQVLINENYRERFVNPNHERIGGSAFLSPKVMIHLWNPQQTHEVGSFHWPHYALRPGMMRREVWDVVGAYNETHQHFEFEYGERYFHNHGYQTGFLVGVNSEHLGKCTWEKEEDIPSAYGLNNVSRFKDEL